MPVNDHETVVGPIVEESGAYPPKVELALFAKVDAWPYSGMDEQIVAEAESIDQTAKEFDVALGYRLAKRLDRDAFFLATKFLWVEAIAAATFRATKAQPAG
jgi:hypothetical protein